MSKYLYICATARSGSTMLDMLLGGHSKAASLGEFSFLGKALSLKQICGCGDKVSNCSEWQKVFDKVRLDKDIDLLDNPYALRQWDTKASVVIDHEQQTFNYLLGAKFRSAVCRLHFEKPLDFSMPLPSQLVKGINNTAFLYETILQEWDKDFIIDSSKNVNKALALYEQEPKKTKIIILVRDGRGVFSSRRRSGFSKRQSLAGWLKYYSTSIRVLQKNIPDDALKIVRYEDVIKDPKKELEHICDWIGVSFEHEMASLSHGVRHLVNGNDTRFKRDKGLMLDERWKTELSDDELEWFMDRAGDLNLKLGYK